MKIIKRNRNKIGKKNVIGETKFVPESGPKRGKEKS